MPEADRRLYLLDPHASQVHAENSDSRRYCHRAEDGGGFHGLAEGEIYVVQDGHDYCLNCAVELGAATFERPTLENLAKRRGG